MNKFKKIGFAFLIFVLYIFLSLCMDVAFQVCFNSDNPWISNISLILSNLFVLLAISLAFLPTIIKDIKSFKKSYAKNAYKNWFFGLLVMYASNIVIISIIKGIASNESYNRNLLFDAPIYAIITMALIAPILEELIFRLSLKDIFKSKWTYAFTSGLIFGLMHMTTITKPIELLYTISYGALGFFFAKSVYETDNIVSSMLAHITHNSLIIAILFLGKYLGV